MKWIICLFRGHDIIRFHAYEPLTQWACRRCWRHFFDRRDDEERNGYCPRCEIGMRYGVLPMRLAEPEQMQAMIEDGVVDQWLGRVA